MNMADAALEWGKDLRHLGHYQRQVTSSRNDGALVLEIPMEFQFLKEQNENNNNKQTNKTLRHSLTMPGPDGGTAPAREHTAHTEAKETKAHYSAVFLGF